MSVTFIKILKPMGRYLISVTLILCNLQLQAQSQLESFFLLLPGKVVFNLDEAARRDMVAKYKANPGDVAWSPDYKFSSFLPKSGYCSIIGGFEGNWEMCYWVTTQGDKIVAVAQTGCGPGCYMEHFGFYRYQGGKLVEQEIPFEAPVLADFFDLSGLSPSERKELEGASYSILFSLPAKGTDIKVHLDELLLEGIPEKAKPRNVTLVWKDGTFEKVVQ